MKAIALFSGGCDSLISMKLLKEQGIEVLAVNFNIGFGSNSDKSEYFRNATAQIPVEFCSIDIREQFFNDILFKPKYGYGKYFNPCIDCHANMFAHAFLHMLKVGADFVMSGEVLGQRPKSQRKQALDEVKTLVREFGKDSRFDRILDRGGVDSKKPHFLDELILRPMSAKLLEPSFPEKMGWVDREKLLDISGRSRVRQLALIEKFGWKHFERPGGGCLLTQDSITAKLRDLSAHRKMSLEDIELVKRGRYLVLSNGARCVIGRNEEDNKKLDTYNPNMLKMELLDGVVGGVGLIENSACRDDIKLGARILLGYSKTQEGVLYRVKVGEDVFSLEPYPREKCAEFLLFR